MVEGKQLPQSFNFSCTYSVIVDHPIEVVFPVLAHGNVMERVVRLSNLCTNFELHNADTISVPRHANLAESSFRGLPSTGAQSLTADDPSQSMRTLPRQAFLLEESVPLLFGLLSRKIQISGTQAWDEDSKLMLYESAAPMGIKVWKLRAFEEVLSLTEATKSRTRRTRVTETIKGRAPALLRQMVENETAQGHKIHMDGYHTLFASTPQDG